MPTYYIYDTLDDPGGLLRDARDERELPPYSHYDVTADAFVGNPDGGDDIFWRSPDLTPIGAIDVPGVIRKLVARRKRVTFSLSIAGETHTVSIPAPPVDPPAVDQDDPFANGLSLVRYENVNGGRRPRAKRAAISS